MKKIIYTLLIAFVCALSFTACTEEQIAPVKGDNGGTVVGDTVKR